MFNNTKTTTAAADCKTFAYLCVSGHYKTTTITDNNIKFDSNEENIFYNFDTSENFCLVSVSNN